METATCTLTYGEASNHRTIVTVSKIAACLNFELNHLTVALIFISKELHTSFVDVVPVQLWVVGCNDVVTFYWILRP